MTRTELAPQVTIPIRPTQSEGENFVENPLETLTPREKDVVALIAQGLSNSKIGDNLFIETRTVERHITSIFSKLNRNIDGKDAEKSARVEAASKYIDQNPDFQNPFDGYMIHEAFSERERGILTLIDQGLTNEAIGKKLLISERTVENHTHNILMKIGIDHKKQDARVVMMLVSRALR